MSSSSNSDDQNCTHTQPPNVTAKEITLKVLIIGDYAVGKTAIVRQYAEGKFSTNYKITVGADFSIKAVAWDNNTQLNIQLWDIAGHERFTAMTRVYYKYASAAAVVFDVSRMATFSSVQKWLNDLRDKISLSDGSPIPVVVMANKCDIAGTSVPHEALDRVCKEWNVKRWYATSAKNNHNIEEAMTFLVSCAMENKLKNISKLNDRIILSPIDIPPAKEKSCCSNF